MHAHVLRALVAVCLALPVAACGGDLDPGSGNDPGTGSHTLFVNGDIEASPTVTNASRSPDFTTDFSVGVLRNDAPVTAGDVTITSNGGTVALVWSSNENRWTGRQNGYYEVYELSITSGEDHVSGVRVDGPALHHFTAPLPGAAVSATVPLEVRWDRDEAAATTELDTEEIDEIVIADTGAYSVPVGGLRSNGGETSQERLRIDRIAQVSPAGAIAGSTVRVQIRNEIEILVQPTGL